MVNDKKLADFLGKREHRLTHSIAIDPVKCSCGKVFRGAGCLKKAVAHMREASKE